jgi:enoyl-CoA hydratase
MTTTDDIGSEPERGRLDADLRDGILSLRIANESRANALDDAILEGLVAELGSERARGTRAILLGGAGGRHFSSGLDLGGLPPERLAAELRAGEGRLRRAAAAVASAPAPVIGVMNGAAFGGALEIAAACDWRIAAEEARFGMPAARIGVVYAAEGLRRFVALLGPARTRELFLTGRPIDAARALEIGLVDLVVPGTEVWERARAAAADVAAGAPQAIMGTRAIVRAIEDALPAGALTDLADGLRERAFASADFAEGLAAFQERRPPEFSGE